MAQSLHRMLALALCATLALPAARAQGGSGGSDVVEEADTGAVTSDAEVAEVMHAAAGSEEPEVPQLGATTTPGPTLPPAAPKPELDTAMLTEPTELMDPPSEPMRVTPYQCTKPGAEGCCDHVCHPLDESCAMGPRTGAYIPKWWLKQEHGGFESCDEKVSMYYDTSIDCDDAIPPYGECGLAGEPFACAYGTACMAYTIVSARCLPVCGKRWRKPLNSKRFAKLWRNHVGVGCTLTKTSKQPRRQFSTLRRAKGRRGKRVKVGKVELDDHDVARPTCIPDVIESGAPGAPGESPVDPLPTPPAPGSPVPPETPGNATGNAERRLALAAQVTGISHAYNEILRMGVKPEDADDVVPQVWSWKTEAFTEICSTYQKEFLNGAERLALDLSNFAGYFEAGSPVSVTGIMAWSAAQYALGALYFEPALDAPPTPEIPDPDTCLPASYQKESAMFYARRQMRFMGRSLVSSIVQSGTPDDFVQIQGVGDSTSFNRQPSWLQPEGQQDRCYFGDAEKPAADTAGQTAAALALLAKYFLTSPAAEPSDEYLAKVFLARAATAYEYTVAMLDKFGELPSVCSQQDACIRNCIGDFNATEDGDCGSPLGQSTNADEVLAANSSVDPNFAVMGPALLYFNIKGVGQQLFAAAAALWDVTGDDSYRLDVDKWWPYYTKCDEAAGEAPPGCTVAEFGGFTFLQNWNNVWPQGLAILAGSERAEPAGVTMTRDDYRGLLRESVQYWSFCYRDGTFFDADFCVKTPDGYAYPTIVPRGNTALSYTALCSAAIYHKLGFDDAASDDMQAARCFMEGQIGYMTNHKCAAGSQPANATCLTPTTEGYSMTVGLGSYSPRRPVSYDANFPVYGDPDTAPNDIPAPNPLCGGTVNGAYIDPPSNGTDYLTDSKYDFVQNEAAQDYTASMMCAFGGYAVLPDDLLTGCGDTVPRTVFTGRG